MICSVWIQWGFCDVFRLGYISWVTAAVKKDVGNRDGCVSLDCKNSDDDAECRVKGPVVELLFNTNEKLQEKQHYQQRRNLSFWSRCNFGSFCELPTNDRVLESRDERVDLQSGPLINSGIIVPCKPTTWAASVGAKQPFSCGKQEVGNGRSDQTDLAGVVVDDEALVPAVEVLVRVDLDAQLLQHGLVGPLAHGVHGGAHVVQDAHDARRILGSHGNISFKSSHSRARTLVRSSRPSTERFSYAKHWDECMTRGWKWWTVRKKWYDNEW